MPQENEVAARLSFIDRPALVVAVVTTAVVVPLFVLAYFGIIHY